MTKSVNKSALPLAALAMFMLLQTAPSHAQFIQSYVSISGNDNNDCSLPVGTPPQGPCLTMARALAQTVAGGEVVIGSPGFLNFFALATTINKSVHISNGSGAEAYFGGHDFATPPSPAITINAGAGDIVSLRGLTIDGEGAGTTGVLIQHASAVHIQNCVIRNFEGTFPWGIVDASSSNSALFVSDTLIYNNGSTPGTGGLLIQPTGTGSVRATLDRAHLENNVVGLWVDGRLTTGTGSRVLLRDSVVTGNATDGIDVVSAAGKAPAFLLVEHTTSLHNGGIGIHADGPHATILLKDNTITQNGTGISATNSGQLISYGNNTNNNNVGPEGAPTGFFSQM